MRKILLIDDDDNLQTIMKNFFSHEGFHCLVASTGFEGISLLKENIEIQLILLDILMPEIDGFRVCEKIREFSDKPILFVSALSNIEDKEKGFDLGADDYISKPVDFRELLLKVRAMIRRYEIYQHGKKDADAVIRIGPMILDTKNSSISISSKKLPLRHMEYEIVKTLCKQRGKLFTAKELYETVWQHPFHPTDQNTIATHIKNIRKKIAALNSNFPLITTIWGRGYKID